MKRMQSFLPFLYVFVILVALVYWGFFFAIFYHLTRFGIGTQPKKISALFLIGAVVLFLLSALAFLALSVSSIKNSSSSLEEKAGSIIPLKK